MTRIFRCIPFISFIFLGNTILKRKLHNWLLKILEQTMTGTFSNVYNQSTAVNDSITQGKCSVYKFPRMLTLQNQTTVGRCTTATANVEHKEHYSITGDAHNIKELQLNTWMSNYSKQMITVTTNPSQSNYVTRIVFLCRILFYFLTKAIKCQFLRCSMSFLYL